MTPDVNVLAAALREGHPHHAVARRWLETALLDCANGGTLELLPMVATGFLRIVTHPKVFSPPTPLKDAFAFLRVIIESNGVTMPELGREWPVLERLCGHKSLSGNELPDAWIAAAIVANGLHLVTFDRDFRRYLTPAQLTLLRP